MVNLGHEASLLQKIEDFAANGKIQNSIGLTKRTVESKIQKLIPTTKQRTKSPISLSGAPSVPKLHFHNSFFAPNTDPANTEMVAFCQNAYDETVNFIGECYRLIHADLQQNGGLPV